MCICASSSSPSCRPLASSRSIEAESGERAWTVLREANPDVLVLDWMMEGMSGLDLVKMIRTDPQTPNPFVPVIMLTGHTHIDRVRQARDAGINEFIAKPVSVKTMMNRLMCGDRKSAPLCAHQELFRSLPPAPGRCGISRTGAPRRRSGPGRGIGERAMARQQPIELFMPPNMLKAKVGGTIVGRRHGRDQARRSRDG